jgi:hypothetical protein
MQADGAGGADGAHASAYQALKAEAPGDQKHTNAYREVLAYLHRNNLLQRGQGELTFVELIPAVNAALVGARRLWLDWSLDVRGVAEGKGGRTDVDRHCKASFVSALELFVASTGRGALNTNQRTLRGWKLEWEEGAQLPSWYSLPDDHLMRLAWEGDGWHGKATAGMYPFLQKMGINNPTDAPEWLHGWWRDTNSLIYRLRDVESRAVKSSRPGGENLSKLASQALAAFGLGATNTLTLPLDDSTEDNCRALALNLQLALSQISSGMSDAEWDRKMACDREVCHGSSSSSAAASSSDATRKDRELLPKRYRSHNDGDAAGSADSTADSTADGAAGGEQAVEGRQLSAMSLGGAPGAVPLPQTTDGEMDRTAMDTSDASSLNSDDGGPGSAVLAMPALPPKGKDLEGKRVKVFDGPNDGGGTVVDVESFVNVGEGYNVRFVEGIRAGERTLMKLKRYEVLGDAESAAPEHSRNRVSQ